MAGYYIAMLPGTILSRIEQASLSNHLAQCLCKGVCDDSLRLTKEWLLKCISVERRTGILKELGSRGGNCDCKVLSMCSASL